MSHERPGTRRPTFRASAGLVLAGLLLGACGTVSAPPAEPGGTPAPRASVACPEPVGGDVPAGCVPYDPEWAMEQNERYRDRMPMDAQTRAANAPVLQDAVAVLEQLGGRVTPEAVDRALTDVGLSGVRTRDADGGVAFGGGAPAGGCVHGAVDAAGTVTAELGGYILDGGCLPAH